jgi:hypothetical protein
MQMLTESLRPDVTAQLGFYVYRLIAEGETFYVGKGTGGRVHEHRGRSDFPVTYEERIVQWGLTEDAALRLEAALISVLDPRLNRVAGHGHTDCDLRTDTLQARLGASLFDVSGIPDGILIVQVRGGVYYPYPGAQPCRHASFDDIAALGEGAIMARVQGDWTCGEHTAKRVRQIAVADGGNVIRRVYDVTAPQRVTHAQNGSLYVIASTKSKRCGQPQPRQRFTQISPASGPSPIVGSRLVFPDGTDPIKNQSPFNLSWELARKAAGMHPVLVVAS